MIPPLEFFIPGLPAPGGSKTAFVARRKGGEIVMRPGTNMPIINMSDAGGERNKVWRKVVAQYGKIAMQGRTLWTGACNAEFVFFLPRPKSTHYRSGKFSHVLRDDAPRFHTQAPDALKYARSTEDALTGIIWRDDSQTIRLCSEKRWCGPFYNAGCCVKVIFLE